MLSRKNSLSLNMDAKKRLCPYQLKRVLYQKRSPTV